MTDKTKTFEEQAVAELEAEVLPKKAFEGQTLACGYCQVEDIAINQGWCLLGVVKKFKNCGIQKCPA
jgi:hypothetical protein